MVRSVDVPGFPGMRIGYARALGDFRSLGVVNARRRIRGPNQLLGCRFLFLVLQRGDASGHGRSLGPALCPQTLRWMGVRRRHVSWPLCGLDLRRAPSGVLGSAARSGSSGGQGSGYDGR